MIARGRVVRPWIGVGYGGEVDPLTAQAYHLDTDHGVVVSGVVPGAPAARADIQAGDIITAVNGRRIEGWAEFVREIAGRKIGETVTVTIVRDHTARSVSVALAVRPTP